jgi:methionyl-tRNA formyltransferase
MAGNMNVLVLCDNDLLKPAEKIFRDTGHKICFTDSININPVIDCEHIIRTYDLVISLHCKQIFPKKLHHRIRCINVHPGFNPFNRGMYPHIFSIINGYPAGVTIHEITEEIDNGPIIIRKQVGVKESDTGESLYHRIIQCEFELLTDWASIIIEGKYKATKTDGGNYNSKEDFKKLCKIDLSGSAYDLYNVMRALYHSDYSNAKLNDTFLKLQIL